MSEKCPICGNAIESDASACPSCGFKLLGSTQKFKPFEINGEEVKPVAEPPARTAALRVVRGPQIETVFHLGDKPLTIGRSPRCDIFLNDMTVSREHARIVPIEGGYRIEDANSYNGVWVNNENVEGATLKDGDILQIGVFCLVYQLNP